MMASTAAAGKEPGAAVKGGRRAGKCLVFLPRKAIRLGAAGRVLPLSRIAAAIGSPAEAA